MSRLRPRALPGPSKGFYCPMVSRSALRTVMAKLKLAIVVGSTRRELINRKLAEALAKLGSDAFEPFFVRSTTCPSSTRTSRRPARADPAPEAGDRGGRRHPDRHARAQSLDPGRAQECDRLGLAPLWQELLGRQDYRGDGHERRRRRHGRCPAAIADDHDQPRRRRGRWSGLHHLFKEGLIDADHEIANEGSRSFLQGFLDNFAKVAGKLAA